MLAQVLAPAGDVARTIYRHDLFDVARTINRHDLFIDTAHQWLMADKPPQKTLSGNHVTRPGQKASKASKAN